MFETRDRSPAGAEYQNKKEAFSFVFMEPEPCAEYYRPDLKSPPKPAESAPDRYSVTSEYLIRVRVSDGNYKIRILCVEHTLRVAIEREAARIRWLSNVKRWPQHRKDVWHIKPEKDGWVVTCEPANEVSQQTGVARAEPKEPKGAK
jgi:hypothetical protein